ncbi:hypothetical protein OE88DRAFT_772309 [Heliocybe sulcata]|uniref:Uncharacterized protein n=1 Tax=Heliocybe sulcata TaxID=5364 RepID=A0A5C3MT11_9AGAM|nr:hypothetical protein OE88DRAFT_772309 [Heliocybe sulcata]
MGLAGGTLLLSSDADVQSGTSVNAFRTGTERTFTFDVQRCTWTERNVTFMVQHPTHSGERCRTRPNAWTQWGRFQIPRSFSRPSLLW